MDKLLLGGEAAVHALIETFLKNQLLIFRANSITRSLVSFPDLSGEVRVRHVSLRFLRKAHDENSLMANPLAKEFLAKKAS